MNQYVNLGSLLINDKNISNIFFTISSSRGLWFVTIKECWESRLLDWLYQHNSNHQSAHHKGETVLELTIRLKSIIAEYF